VAKPKAYLTSVPRLQKVPKPPHSRSDGILRTTFLIDGKGVIRKVYPKVSPKTHTAEVLADIDALNG